MRPTTTGIGSLPFSTMKEAFEHARKNYDIPFSPQFDRGDGDGGMLTLVLPAKLNKRQQSGFGVALTDLLEDGVIRESFLDCDSAFKTPAFLDAQELAAILQGQDRLAQLKTQIMGPLSLLQTLRDAASRPLWSDVQLHQPILQWCIALSCEIAKVLAPCTDQLTIWVDEPMLGLMENEADREVAFQLLSGWQQALAATGVKTGIHCCSAPPFEVLNVADFSTFSCDVVRYEDEIKSALPDLKTYIDKGGQLALGLLAPMNWSDDVDQRPFVRQLCQSLELTSPSDRHDHLLLTPSCGTMLTPLDRELEIATTLKTWAASLAED